MNRTIRLAPACISLFGALALAAGLSSPAPAQSLQGQTIREDYDYPAVGTVNVPLGSITVGNGATYFLPQPFLGMDASVSPTQITVFNTNVSPVRFTPATFDGYVFTETGAAPFAFTGLTVDASSTVAGFPPAFASFTAGSVDVNLSGVTFRPGDALVLDITGAAAPVPEASGAASLGLLLALGAAGLVIRRRRAA